jgi:hypothetical protein
MAKAKTFSATVHHWFRNEFGLFGKGDGLVARTIEDNGTVQLDGRKTPAIGVSMLIPGAAGNSENDFVYFRVPKGWVKRFE